MRFVKQNLLKGETDFIATNFWISLKEQAMPLLSNIET